MDRIFAQFYNLLYYQEGLAAQDVRWENGQEERSIRRETAQEAQKGMDQQRDSMPFRPGVTVRPGFISRPEYTQAERDLCFTLFGDSLTPVMRLYTHSFKLIDGKRGIRLQEKASLHLARKP
ncbi:hypothetical protein FN846DRAFT_891364 [Sphaerosporella brunnea]|uniref:Uncharacterized protein n=1 Tax=Sphaerosporella brunnea TaxID=1250544 RepID=A0A5J5ETM9_9PEZI|nr:hypothetical protein FN846DRAFT_891364 [Sphaerosporella brunnea]